MNRIIKRSAAIVLTAVLAFGSAPAAAGSFLPGMSISASAVETTSITVNSWDALAEAVNNLPQGSILNATASADLTANVGSSAIVVQLGRCVKLNLNGHTLNRNLSEPTLDGYAIRVEKGGELEVTGGTITGANNMFVEEDRPVSADSEVTIPTQISGNGGAIYCMSGGCVVLKSVTVKGNKAYNGAGLWMDSRGLNDKDNMLNSEKMQLSIKNSTFSNNTAENMGGGICMNRVDQSNTDYYSIDGSTFTGNTAKMGGGLGLDNAQALKLENSSVKNNTAEFGGGVYALKGYALSVLDTAVSGNKADNGGGIYAETSAQVKVQNGSSVTNNTAVNGGGIYLKSASANMGDEKTIIYNQSSVDGRADITNNSADEKGGGVYVDESGTFSARYGSIAYNTVSQNGKGAGIYNVGTVLFDNDSESSEAAQRYKPLTVINNSVTAEKDGLTLNLPSNLCVAKNGQITNSTQLHQYQNDQKYMVAIGISVDDVTFDGDYEGAPTATIFSYNTQGNGDNGTVFFTDDEAYMIQDDFIGNIFEVFDGSLNGDFYDSCSYLNAPCTLFEEGLVLVTTAGKTDVNGENYYAVWSNGDVRYQQGGTVSSQTKIVGMNAVLGGDVGFRFGYTLSESDAARASSLKVKFTWTVNNESKSAESKLTLSDGNYYATLHLNPAEISSKITAKLVDESDNVLNTVTDQSFNTYLNTVASTNSRTDMGNLACAYGDYGTFLQEIFGINTDNLANSVIGPNNHTYAAITDTISSTEYATFKSSSSYEREKANISSFASDDMEYIGTSLLFLQKTTLRHYFKVNEGAAAPEATFTYDGVNYTVQPKMAKKNSDWVYYDLENISIENWGKNCTVQFNGSEDKYNYCPLDYALAVFANSFETGSTKQEIDSVYIKLSKAMHYCYDYAVKCSSSN